MDKTKLAKYIDHTVLGIKASKEDVVKLCNEAKQYGFASVCVSPSYVALAAKEVKNTDVKVCTVIGFPNGYTTTEVKAFEMKEMIRLGATELDMVLNLQDVANKNWEGISKELHTLRSVAKNQIIKLIIESTHLDAGEVTKVCELAVDAKLDFVKTSTGFNNSKASREAVQLMKKAVGNNAQIKASGGVRSYKDALDYINLGATRLGTSSGIKILEEA